MLLFSRRWHLLLTNFPPELSLRKIYIWPFSLLLSFPDIPPMYLQFRFLLSVPKNMRRLLPSFPLNNCLDNEPKKINKDGTISRHRLPPSYKFQRLLTLLSFDFLVLLIPQKYATISKMFLPLLKTILLHISSHIQNSDELEL